MVVLRPVAVDCSYCFLSLFFGAATALHYLGNARRHVRVHKYADTADVLQYAIRASADYYTGFFQRLYYNLSVPAGLPSAEACNCRSNTSYHSCSLPANRANFCLVFHQTGL